MKLSMIKIYLKNKKIEKGELKKEKKNVKKNYWKLSKEKQTDIMKVCLIYY